MKNIAFEQTQISNLSVHFVGNRTKGELLKVTDNKFQLNDEHLYEALKSYFFSPFKGDEIFTFQEQDASVATIIKQMFESPLSFHSKSKELAHYLYQCGTNKKIAGGQLYVAYIKDIIYNDEVLDGIGIFKAEHKQTFLKCKEKQDEADLHADTGFSIDKLDKGCIILDTNADEGYRAVMVDNNKSIAQALYWKTDFLGLIRVDEEYFLTGQCLKMIKEFARDVMNIENDITKEETLEFLQKSSDYFDPERAEFDVHEFVKKVDVEPEFVEQFMAYKESFEEDFHLPSMSKMVISQPAVDKFAAKYFKSTIKLDRNYVINVNGHMPASATNIERGYDEKKKMHYYKLYFNTEE